MVALSVPVATFQGPCAGSPGNVMDSFPGPARQRQDIVGIAKIMDGEVVVGWIYRTQHNTYYVQAMPNMPAQDQMAAHIFPVRFDPRFRRLSDRSTPPLYSGLARISHWPWRDLRMQVCGSRDVVPSLQKQ